jgi:hypothetical protein
MSRLPVHVQFLVFSDDIPWCQAHITGPRVHYSQAADDLTDLARMRACDGYIIANSSFSWWAAWLSDQENPVVIAPTAEQWFGKKLMQTGLWEPTILCRRTGYANPIWHDGKGLLPHC